MWCYQGIGSSWKWPVYLAVTHRMQKSLMKHKHRCWRSSQPPRRAHFAFLLLQINEYIIVLHSQYTCNHRHNVFHDKQMVCTSCLRSASDPRRNLKLFLKVSPCFHCGQLHLKWMCIFIMSECQRELFRTPRDVLTSFSSGIQTTHAVLIIFSI